MSWHAGFEFAVAQHDAPADLRVLIQIFSNLRVGGVLVQFTYSPLPPIPDVLAAALGVSGRRVARVFSNLPPAAVWVYQVHSPR